MASPRRCAPIPKCAVSISETRHEVHARRPHGRIPSAPRGGRPMSALELRRLSAYYGEAQVLFGVDLVVAPGEVVALVGRNGAGKTSLLRAAIGLGARTEGQVRLDGIDVSRLPPHARARPGLGYVPEDRRIFTDLTVAENLRLVARQEPGGLSEADLLTQFPNLASLLERPACAISGGDQQILSEALTLVVNLRVVLLGEPSVVI